MKFNRREAVATLLVAAMLVPYVGYSVGGSMPFVEDARGMGATGLILGLAAWMTLGPDAFGPRWLGVGGALAAATLGITAVILETGTASTLFLGGFVVVTVGMWIVAIVRHQSEQPSGSRRASHA